jgi:predicted esterase
MSRAPVITRRRFGAIAASVVAPLMLDGACALAGESGEGADGRLTARPTRTDPAARRAKPPANPSATPLGLGDSRDAILQMPAKAAAGPLPLLVFLHGAGNSADRLLRRYGPAADAAGLAVLAPDSRGSSWDALRGGFGPDVAFINRALVRVFAMIDVDPARVSVGGFSDGASYALSLGLINGDLFSRVVAFSPGFVVPGTPHGTPKFFISHGTADPILPIDNCSRVIVPALRKSRYDVTYREFDGAHEAPDPIAREGMAWAAQRESHDHGSVIP